MKKFIVFSGTCGISPGHCWCSENESGRKGDHLSLPPGKSCECYNPLD